MVTLDLGVIAVTVLKRPRSVLGLLITIYTQSLHLTWLTALNSIPMMPNPPAYIFPSPLSWTLDPYPVACPTLGCPRERAQHNMSKTRLLRSLISMKTHSSFFSHSTFNPLGNSPHSIFKISLPDLLTLCSCSHSDVRHHHLSSGLLHEPLFSPPASASTHRPPHPALSTEAKWSR